MSMMMASDLRSRKKAKSSFEYAPMDNIAHHINATSKWNSISTIGEEGCTSVDLHKLSLDVKF